MSNRKIVEDFMDLVSKKGQSLRTWKDEDDPIWTDYYIKGNFGELEFSLSDCGEILRLGVDQNGYFDWSS